MRKVLKRLLCVIILTSIIFTEINILVEPIRSMASNTVIVLDPGHGGSDSGANACGIQEKNVNLSIALYARNTLSTYAGVTVYLTRDSDTYPSLIDRSIYAADVDADLFVSIHNNAGGSTGSEVYVPYSYNNSSMTNLGNSILSRLSALGLSNRGVKTRTYEEDGSIYDYYSVIREGVARGVSSIIVEHAFVDNQSDAANYLSNQSQLQLLGEADAVGIANYLGLSKGAPSGTGNGSGSNILPNDSSMGVTYQSHVQNIGWMDWTSNSGITGTQGQALRMEALNVKVTGLPAGASLVARSHVQNYGWSYASSIGGYLRLGTEGEGLRMEAIQLTLKGAPGYGVRYRTHVQDIGWQDWSYQGATAGTIGLSKRIEAIQIEVVKDSRGITEYNPSVAAQAHVQDYGWMSVTQSSEMVGTQGESKRIEGMIVDLVNAQDGAYISGSAHIQNIGWVDYPQLNSGVLMGTTGQSLRLEGVVFRLNNMPGYTLQYRVHIQNIGWTDWISQGNMAGTEGQSLRLEALQFRIVK